MNLLELKKKKLERKVSLTKETRDGILSFCKITSETLDYFFDTTPNKIGKYMPGSHIYIKRYSKPLTNEADYVFLGAWNFKKEIFKKEKKYIKNGGKFITHVPVPKII